VHCPWPNKPPWATQSILNRAERVLGIFWIPARGVGLKREKGGKGKGKGARAKGKFCCANKLEAQVSLGKRKEVDEDVEAMCNKQKYSEHVPVPPFLLAAWVSIHFLWHFSRRYRRRKKSTGGLE